MKTEQAHLKTWSKILRFSLAAGLATSCGIQSKDHRSGLSQQSSDAVINSKQSEEENNINSVASYDLSSEDVIQAFENADKLEDQKVSQEDLDTWEKSLVSEDSLKPKDFAQLLNLEENFLVDESGREVIDLRSNDTGIRNQGSEGTCTAFATVASLENLIKRFYGQSLDLSERHHWTTYANYQTTTSLKRASDTPIVAESVWPYKGRKPSSIKNLGLAKVDQYKTIKLQLGPVVESLRNGDPVVIAVGVLSSMMNPKQGGIITGGYAKRGAGHALAVTGAIIDERVPGGGYFILKNSWGSKWGDKGYGYASFDYCKRTWCSAYSISDASMFENGSKLEKTLATTPAEDKNTVNDSSLEETPTVDYSEKDFVLSAHESTRRLVFGNNKAYYVSLNASPDVLKSISKIQYDPGNPRYTVRVGSRPGIAVSPREYQSPDFFTKNSKVQTSDVTVFFRNGKQLVIKGINFEF